MIIGRHDLFSEKHHNTTETYATPATVLMLLKFFFHLGLSNKINQDCSGCGNNSGNTTRHILLGPDNPGHIDKEQ
ncbi:Uncharacterised protein [Sphingobacterium multivorum]|uniref:Uncharacterized protein n=1 Tax=Sphingobacterium multivorum TaxID=28454 RepID=A0A2X2ITS9_SPHMU|nr:Uncharacterised protein [Sphingobacterium multivorum]